MLKLRKMLTGGDKGFTLIELLVVIAVLGILAAIAIPRISGVTDKAQESEMRATASSLRSAIELYIASEDSFPYDSATSLDFSESDYNLGINLSDYDISGVTDSTTDYSITIDRADSDWTATISPGGISTSK